MKRINFFLIIFVFILSLSVQAEEIPLTLDEAIAIALRDNRDVLIKAEDVKKAKEKIAEAKADFFPSLSFTGSWTNTRGYYSKDLSQTTTQATLKQYLYRGGKTMNTLRQNQYKLEVSGALLDKTKLEMVLNVKKAFYTLILSQDFTSLNKGIADNIQEHMNVIKERYQNGQASESDLLSLEASLSSAQQVHQESLNQAEASLASLNNLLFLEQETKIKPLAELNYEPIEVAYDSAFLQAMKARPEIRQYEAQIKADKKAIEITKSSSLPSIYASWDYYSRSHLGATTSRNWNDYNIVGLTFSWPIFDGWATRAKVEQAAIDLKTTQLSKEKAVKDIALEIKNTYISLRNAIAKLDNLESELVLYKNNLAAAEEKYKQGEVSLLDKDDADLKYQISLFNKKEAAYDYFIAKSSFEKATGGL